MHPLRWSLFALLLLIVFSAGEADADKEPVWIFTPETPYNPEYLSATISGDGEYVVVSAGRDSGRNSDGVVYLFRNNTLLWNHTEGDTARDPLISDNGEYVVVHHRTSQCEMEANDHNHCPPYFSVFRSENGTPLWQIEWNISGGLQAVDITTDGEYILVTGSTSYWDTDAGLYLLRSGNSTPIRNYTLDINRGKALAISADGEYIVATGYVIQWENRTAEGKITFFSKENSTPLWEYRFMPIQNSDTFDGPEMHVSISEDGAFIAIAKGRGGDCNGDCGSSKIYLFNKESNTTVWEYTPTDGGTFFNSIDMSSDGQYIITSATDGKIYIFHRDSNIPIWIYDAEEKVSKTIISNDGKYIAGFKEGYVFTLERESKTLLWEYNIGVSIKNIEMSANAKYIVVNTQDTVYLFENNIDTGEGSSMLNPKESDSFFGGVGGQYSKAKQFFDERSSTFLIIGTVLLVGGVGVYYFRRDTIDYSPIKQNTELAETIRRQSFIPKAELVNIECPGCDAQMKVPKLNELQEVACKECGLSGEIEI